MTGEITTQTFLDAASEDRRHSTPTASAGVLDFTKEWTGGGGEFPRIFNRVIYIGRDQGRQAHRRSTASR